MTRPEHAIPEEHPTAASTGPRSVGSLSLVGLWVGVLIALVLAGAVQGLAVHRAIAAIDAVTLEDFAGIRNGMSPSAVEALLGPAQATARDGGITHRWTNDDGSSLTVVIAHDMVSSVSQSGLETADRLEERARRSTTPTMTLVLAVASFLVWAATLVTATTLRTLTVAPWRILAIAAVGPLLGLVPVAGVPLALVALVALVRRWTSATWSETLAIVVAIALLEAAAAIPLYLGFVLATSLLS